MAKKDAKGNTSVVIFNCEGSTTLGSDHPRRIDFPGLLGRKHIAYLKADNIAQVWEFLRFFIEKSTSITDKVFLVTGYGIFKHAGIQQTGLTLAQRVKLKYPFIEIVFVTSVANSSRQTKMKRLGIIIEEPTTPEKILKAIS